MNKTQNFYESNFLIRLCSGSVVLLMLLNVPTAEASKRSERLRKRAERIEKRQAKREERKQERKENRQERRANRQERRQERQANRQERRQNRKLNRVARKLVRQGHADIAQQLLAKAAREKSQQGSCSHGFVQTSQGCVARGTPAYMMGVPATNQTAYVFAPAIVDTPVAATCADGYLMDQAGNCVPNRPTPIIRKPASSSQSAL